MQSIVPLMIIVLCTVGWTSNELTARETGVTYTVESRPRFAAATKNTVTSISLSAYPESTPSQIFTSRFNESLDDPESK